MIDKIVTTKHPLIRDNPYLVKRLQEIDGLTKDQIEIIIYVIWDTCGQCHENDARCQCWNDE